MVIPFYWLLWLLLFCQFLSTWMIYQQTCSFRKLLYWGHSPCCVPFWRMVNKSFDCFVVLGGIIKASSVLTNCVFAVALLEAASTCIVKCGKSMRPFFVSITTLLFLIKCNPFIGPVNFFITTTCSPSSLSLVSNLSVAVAYGFSIWPFADCIRKLGCRQFWDFYLGLSVFFASNSFWEIALT